MNKWCIYISLLLLLVASSCSYDEYPEPDGSNPPTQQGDGSDVIFRLTFTGDDEGLDTRSISEVSENKIDSLHLYIFKASVVDPNDRMKDTLMYTVKATDITDTGASPHQVKTAKAKFKGLPVGQRFIMIANKPTTMALNYIEGKTTLAEFMPQLKFAASAWQNGTTMVDGSFTPFPMFGQSTKFRYVGAVISGLDPYPSTIDVAMIRSMAKVQLRVDINNNTGDPALGGASYFRIDSIFVCNYADSGYIAPNPQYYASDSLSINGITHTNPLRPTQVKNIGYKFPTSVAHTVPFLNNTIYVTERDTSYLILKAYYYDQLCYYRVDFVKGMGSAAELKPVLRNHIYNFVITGLRTKGFDTMTEAQNAILPKLNPYLVLDNAAADITDIVYNRDNFLGLSSTVAKFDWMGGGYVANFDTPPIEITVKTMQDMPVPDITGLSGSGATALSWSTTGVANERKLIIRRTGVNLDQGNQTETIVLTTKDNLQQTIKIIHYPGPYSYMVGAGANNTVAIPAASAMAYGRTSLTSADFNNKEVVLAYVSGTPTVPPSFVGPTIITSVNQQIVVSRGTATSGYFIVVLRDLLTHKIYWSWMVWIVPDIPGHPNSITAGSAGYTGRSYNGPSYIFNSLEYMHSDLGEETATLNDVAFFQWGRKDAFKQPTYWGGSPYKAAPAHILCNVDSANANPFTFYYNNVSPFDWKRDWQNNNMWVDVDGEKGPYDPCPFGWRVPPAENDSISPWKGFANTYNGLTFNLNGGIDGLTGTYNSASTHNVIWSGSARSTQAHSLRLPNTMQNAYRANGYTVRCVRDNIRKLK